MSKVMTLDITIKFYGLTIISQNVWSLPKSTRKKHQSYNFGYY